MQVELLTDTVAAASPGEKRTHLNEKERKMIRWILIAGVCFICTNALAERTDKDDESAITDPRVQHLSYRFEETGEEIPYALFVPKSYDPDKPAPLIISLHGLGRQYDWLMGYHGLLDAAEAGGYLVVTPLGYTRRGWFGSWRKGLDDRDLSVEGVRSAADVMNVFGLVKRDHNIDDNRIYLWGHSMGGAGTYHLASKYPKIWAGLGVVAPAPNPSTDAAGTLLTIRDIPIIVLQGTEDGLIARTRAWVAQMKNLGMPHVYIEVDGGDHSLFISQNANNMRKVVSFFDIVRKNYR